MSKPLPPLPPLPNSTALNDVLSQGSNDVNPADVVVLIPPDPNSVVSGKKRYVNATHIKWVVNNVLTTATNYAKLELTGERIFWVPNASELLQKHADIKIPFSTKGKGKKQQEEVFLNCKLMSYTKSTSESSYRRALDRANNSTLVAITLYNFAVSDIGSDDLLKKIAA